MDPPSRYGLRHEDVTFRAADGVRLNGWWIPAEAEAPVIILCHGLGANKSDLTDLATALHGAGYHVLQFDFRAHGDSEGHRTSFGWLEQQDLEAAMAYLASQSVVARNRIGVYGFSMGAAVAILAAAKHPEIRAVVADSAYASLADQIAAAAADYRLPAIPFAWLGQRAYELLFWTRVVRIAPVTAIAALSPRPVLIIAGGADSLMPPEDAHRLYQAAKEPKELWVVPEAPHGGTLAAAGPAYAQRVIAFFDRVLRGAARRG